MAKPRTPWKRIVKEYKPPITLNSKDMKLHEKVLAANCNLMSRVMNDPHHSGAVEWGWIERTQQLYCRMKRKRGEWGPWRLANNVHITPKRAQLLNKLINN
jgi:hypothetical protein